MGKCPFHNLDKYDPETLQEDRLMIVANDVSDMKQDIVVAPVKREWMEETPQRFAYRCLPLNTANDLGWQILCPHSVEVYWNGRNGINDLSVQVDGSHHLASSHFGNGVLTFNLQYVFRTTKNQCLYLKGPTNHPKRGIYALEGFIETDWLPFTFTMNWKVTEPNRIIRFEKGEPFCQFFPYQKNYIEEFEPTIQTASQGTMEMYQKYAKSRDSFNKDLKDPESEAARMKWQKYYFQGRYPEDDHSVKCSDLGFTHNTKSGTKPFVDNREKPRSVFHTL
jgi:hypothetical protein